MSQSRQQCHESCPCHTWGGRGCCDEDQTMKNEKHVEMRAWKCWAWWVKGPNTESCVRKHRGPRSWGLRRSKTNWKQWVQKHFPLCSIQCRVRSCHSSHWGAASAREQWAQPRDDLLLVLTELPSILHLFIFIQVNENHPPIMNELLFSKWADCW